jgi:glutaredoxin 3
MEIRIYSSPTCPYCIQAKNYFNKKNITFRDFDVAHDTKAAQEMLDLSGQMGVPVIKIDDEVIVGFDQDKIEKLINKK